MAELNIAEKRVPQDGRISMKVGGKQLDLRLATLPTVFGEKVVIRILDKSQALLKLEDPGFEESLQAVRGLVPQAVRGDPRDRSDRIGQVDHDVLDAQHPQRGDKNIITVEDPVEYRLNGVNQMQVNPKAGLTRERAALDPARRPRHRADR